MKFGTGERITALVPIFTFIGAEMWEYSHQNCQNFKFCACYFTTSTSASKNLPIGGGAQLHNFYEIIILRIYRELLSFFNLIAFGWQTTKLWGFSCGGGIFPQIFSSGETSPPPTDRIKKKLAGCKNGTDLLCHSAKDGWDRGSRAGCRRKSYVFLSDCLSRFGITDAMKQCNFQNNYGTVA